MLNPTVEDSNRAVITTSPWTGEPVDDAIVSESASLTLSRVPLANTMPVAHEPHVVASSQSR